MLSVAGTRQRKKSNVIFTSTGAISGLEESPKDPPPRRAGKFGDEPAKQITG